MDSLVHSFVAAEDENSAQNFLDRLFEDHARPLIGYFVRLKLRSLGHTNSDEQQDVCQEVAVQLLTRLWEIKANPALPPIDNFRGYLFTSVQNACYKQARMKHPAWWRLKNRIRYLLNHKPQFAVWSEKTEQTICGLAGWAGQSLASSEANLSQVDLSEFPSKVLLDNLVGAMAEICGVREAQFVETSSETGGTAESLRDSSLNPASQLEQKVHLERLWHEICELPLNQRLALLLLAHAGVLEEAAEEFRAVSQSDPNHSLATRFEREAQEMIVRQGAGLVR